MKSKLEKTMDLGLIKAIEKYQYESKMALSNNNYPENGPFSNC